MEKVIQVAREMGCTIDHEDDEVTKTLHNEVYEGYLVELEHGTKWGVNSPANVTNNDTRMTIGIAWAHILEDPIYYMRLEKSEKRGEAFLDQLESGQLCKTNQTIKKMHEALNPSRKDMKEDPLQIKETLDQF